MRWGAAALRCECPGVRGGTIMSAPDSGSPGRRRPRRSPVPVNLTVALGSGGTAALLLFIAQRVLLFPHAGAFEEVVAGIFVLAVAAVAVAVPIGIIVRYRLLWRAGWRAIDTIESNDQARETYWMLDASTRLRRSRRSRWGLPGATDEVDAVERTAQEEGGGKV